jgi:hypothetical protein
MRIKTTVFALALSIAATGALFASEIYKWTDSEGNVYFSDIPTAGSEHLSIRSRPTDLARIQAQAQSRTDVQTLKAEEQASVPQGPTPEELREEARDREEKCNKYRDRQTQFTRSRRIYRMENGERVYYDEQEMQAARAGVDEQVQKYCN